MGSLRSLKRSARQESHPTLRVVKPISTVFESEQSQDTLGTITGVFTVSDCVSKNKTIYPADVLKNILNNESIQSLVKNNRLFGSLIMSDRGVEGLSNFSHILTEIDEYPKKPGIGRCRLKVIDTPAGRSLVTLIKAGISIYPCLEGAGSLRKNIDGTRTVITSTFRFHTIHLATEWVWNNG
jgi:hypothetical protein